MIEQGMTNRRETTPHVARAARRGTATVAVLAAILMTALTGCSSGSDDAAAQSSTTSSEQFPVTVNTKNGDVTIDSTPERIVTLGNPAFENVVALGSTPVAANVYQIEESPYLGDYSGKDYLDSGLGDIYAGEVNVEAVAAKNPDLIVVPAWPVFTDPTTLANLRELAPTLVFDTQDASTDWRVGVEQVARALGESEKGRQLVDAAVAKYAAVGKSLPGLGNKPYSFGLYMSGTVSLASGGNVLKLFGMTPAADQNAVETDGKQVAYSQENLSQVNGDIVMLMPYPQDAKADLEGSSLWGSPQKQVVWLSDAQGEAINNAGILGKSWLPADLEPTLKGIVAS